MTALRPLTSKNTTSPPVAGDRCMWSHQPLRFSTPVSGSLIDSSTRVCRRAAVLTASDATKPNRRRPSAAVPVVETSLICLLADREIVTHEGSLVSRKYPTLATQIRPSRLRLGAGPLSPRKSVIRLTTSRSGISSKQRGSSQLSQSVSCVAKLSEE